MGDSPRRGKRRILIHPPTPKKPRPPPRGKSEGALLLEEAAFWDRVYGSFNPDEELISFPGGMDVRILYELRRNLREKAFQILVKTWSDGMLRVVDLATHWQMQFILCAMYRLSPKCRRKDRNILIWLLFSGRRVPKFDYHPSEGVVLPCVDDYIDTHEFTSVAGLQDEEEERELKILMKYLREEMVD